jgi:lysophospholipase L1-like esterase
MTVLHDGNAVADPHGADTAVPVRNDPRPHSRDLATEAILRMKPALPTRFDGIHPNEKGYAIVGPWAQAVIDKTLWK